MEIKKNGKYFIKDAELSTKEVRVNLTNESKVDKFKHFDIAANIINIIENENPPFNIAIVGKWGLGKSSLINMVKAHFEPMKDQYIVDEVNAWKYEKEALRRVLLRNLLRKLEYNDKTMLDKIFDNLRSHSGSINEETPKWKEILSEWIPLLFTAIVLYALGIVFALLGQCIFAKVNFTQFDFKGWVSFVLGGFASNIYIPIFAVLIQQYIKGSSGRFNFKVIPPITSTDEYEKELSDRLNEDNPKYKDKKIIMVIDDLDRLTPSKIVEALDAIKAFVGYPNCIFIVPFDDTILKEALSKEKTQFLNNEHLTIESDLFLDKLFQYKVFLPSAIQLDMPQYAVDIASIEADDLVKLCGKEQFELLCKEILIHKNVTTPRQVKKILNTFANNILLGHRREVSEVKEGTFTSKEGTRILAIISVLQADFSTFYSNLFSDNDLVKKYIYDARTSLEDGAEPPSALNLTFFDKVTNKDNVLTYKMNNLGESLFMFLSQIYPIKTDNIAQFLYLDNDKLSTIFGNDFSRTVKNGLSSGAYELVESKIKENSDKNLSHLFYEILAYSQPNDYVNCCTGIIVFWDYYSGSDIIRLLNLLDERVNTAIESSKEFDISKLDFNSLVQIYKRNVDYYGIEFLITQKLIYEGSGYSDALNIYFENEALFSEKIKECVQNFINNKLNSDVSNLTFDDFFVVPSFTISQYFDDYMTEIDLYEKLSKHFVETEYEEDEALIGDALIELFELHVERLNANSIYEAVSNYVANDSYCKLLIDSINKYKLKLNDELVINKMSMQLMKVNDRDIHPRINDFLVSKKWDIKKGENDTVDTYLEANISRVTINALLLNIVDGKKVNLIPKTIHSMFENITSVDIDTNTIKAIDVFLSDEQRITLFEKIDSILVYSESHNIKELNRISEILSILSLNKINHIYISSSASKIYSILSSHGEVANKYVNVLVDCVDAISDEVKNNFISYADSYIASYPIVCISIWGLFYNSVTKSKYLATAKQIIAYAKDTSLCTSLFLLRKFKSSMLNDTSELNSYLKYLVSKLSISEYQKEVLNDIDSCFETVEDVASFILAVSPHTKIQQEAIIICEKFLKAPSIDADNEIKHVITKIEATSYPFLIALIEKYYGGNINEKISEFFREATSDESVMYLFNLANLEYESESITVNIDNKYHIIELLLEMADDTMLGNIFPLINSLNIANNKTLKRKLGDSLYKTFISTNSLENKQQIVYFIKKEKLNYVFSYDSQKNKRSFSNSDIELLENPSE